LVHAMQLAITAKDADGEAFFVGDRETVTWFDFYRPFAISLGVDPNQIPSLDLPEFRHSRKQEIMSAVRESELVQKTLTLISDDFKQRLKQMVPKRDRPVTLSAEIPGEAPQPVVTEMMSILQRSQYQLPFSKATNLLGYEPIVSFEEGCQRSIVWLADCEAFRTKLASMLTQ
jgi:hypothetical protein